MSLFVQAQHLVMWTLTFRGRNVNDVSSVFSRFLLDFGVLFCVAGLVKLEGDSCCAAHCKDVSCEEDQS